MLDISVVLVLSWASAICCFIVVCFIVATLLVVFGLGTSDLVLTDWLRGYLWVCGWGSCLFGLFDVWCL